MSNSYNNFKNNDLLYYLFLVNNSCNLINYLFSGILNSQILFDDVFLLLPTNRSFKEPMVGYNNKHNFLSQVQE